MLPKLFDIPFLGWPINSYGAAIMIGFLLATYIAVRRLRTLSWKLDLERPGNRRLVADDLVRRGKVKAEKVPDEDPIDLAALDVSDVARDESVGAVTDRKNSDFILDLAIISMIFGLIGGKIIYMLQYPDQMGESFHIFDVTDGRLHPMGAFAGLIPIGMFFWITRKRRIMVKNVRKTFAIMAATTLLFALAGTRAWYVYKNSSEFQLDTFRSWQSGFVLYGGLILGFSAGVVYGFLRKRPILLTADIVSPTILLGIAFGRIGCFLNGCCFGKDAPDFPLAVSYPPHTPPYDLQLENKLIDFDAAKSLPVHPVQLYEAAAMVVLFFVLSKLWKKNLKPGVVTALTGLSYAGWRFLIEFLRADKRPVVFAGLSFSQVVSLGVAVVCVVAAMAFRKREAPAPELQA